MENLFELRLETKRLLRDNIPSQKEYEEALPLCKKLWEAFSETNNLWDAQQYANCLKQLNMICVSFQYLMKLYFYICHLGRV